MPDIKTIEMIGKAGRIFVNRSDEEMYRKKGYRRPDEVVNEKSKPKKAARQTPKEERPAPKSVFDEEKDE